MMGWLCGTFAVRWEALPHKPPFVNSGPFRVLFVHFVQYIVGCVRRICPNRQSRGWCLNVCLIYKGYRMTVPGYPKEANPIN